GIRDLYVTGVQTCALPISVRRIVRLAEEVGIRAGTPWPDEGKLLAVRQRMGRPGAVVVTREAEELLKPRTEQIRAWLDKDHLLQIGRASCRERMKICEGGG